MKVSRERGRRRKKELVEVRTWALWQLSPSVPLELPTLPWATIARPLRFNQKRAWDKRKTKIWC